MSRTVEVVQASQPHFTLTSIYILQNCDVSWPLRFHPFLGTLVLFSGFVAHFIVNSVFCSKPFTEDEPSHEQDCTRVVYI